MGALRAGLDHRRQSGAARGFESPGELPTRNDFRHLLPGHVRARSASRRHCRVPVRHGRRRPDQRLAPHQSGSRDQHDGRPSAQIACGRDPADLSLLGNGRLDFNIGGKRFVGLANLATEDRLSASGTSFWQMYISMIAVPADVDPTVGVAAPHRDQRDLAGGVGVPFEDGRSTEPRRQLSAPHRCVCRRQRPRARPTASARLRQHLRPELAIGGLLARLAHPRAAMELNVGHLAGFFEHDECPVSAVLDEPHQLGKLSGAKAVREADSEGHPVDHRQRGRFARDVSRLAGCDAKWPTRCRNLTTLQVMPAVWAATEGALLAPLSMTCDCDTPGYRA